MARIWSQVFGKGASHLNQKRKVVEYYNYSYLRFRGNTGSASCLNYKKNCVKTTLSTMPTICTRKLTLKNFTPASTQLRAGNIFACYIRHKKCVMSELLMDILRARHERKTP